MVGFEGEGILVRGRGDNSEGWRGVGERPLAAKHVTSASRRRCSSRERNWSRSRCRAVVAALMESVSRLW